MYYAAKKEVLLVLYQHTMMTAQQLSQLLHYQIPSIYGMATELRKQGLIRSIPLPFLRKNHVGYILSSYGARAAATLSSEETIIRSKAWEEDPVQLEHIFGTNAFFISLVRHSLSSLEEGLAEWLCTRDAAERYAHFKDSGRKFYPLRPDGIGTYLVQNRRGRLILHLEYDTGTENLSRLQDKLNAYGRVLPGIWNEVEQVHVLIVTRGKGRPERILKTWESLCHGVFLGICVPQVWAIEERAWQTGGFVRAQWIGKNGEKKPLREFSVLPLAWEAQTPLLGKQRREPSPMQSPKKGER